MIPLRLDCLLKDCSRSHQFFIAMCKRGAAGVVEPSPRGLVFCPPRQEPAFTKASGNPGETYLVGQKTWIEYGPRGPPGAEGAGGRQWDGAVGTIFVHKPVDEGIYSVFAAGETQH